MADGVLEPGTFVVHPEAPDWGVGQIQSAIGGRVTVNFEHAGKQLINVDAVALEVIDAAEAGRRGGVSARPDRGGAKAGDQE